MALWPSRTVTWLRCLTLLEETWVAEWKKECEGRGWDIVAWITVKVSKWVQGYKSQIQVFNPCCVLISSIYTHAHIHTHTHRHTRKFSRLISLQHAYINPQRMGVVSSYPVLTV